MREMSQSFKEIKEKKYLWNITYFTLTMAWNLSRQVCKIYLNENFLI